MDERRNRSIRMALGLVTLALVVASAALRLVDEGSGDRAAPLGGSAGGACLGVAYGGRALGVSCGTTVVRAIENAVERLGLPRDCRDVVLPAALANGDSAVFDEGGGGCACVRVERLPGSQRLLVGAGLDVNRDTARDLTALPAIGEARARLIVESRERDGPFKGIEDLSRVEGIGPRTVERLEPLLEW